MPDLEHYSHELEKIIDRLDPGRDEVAICHLRDALDAMHATLRAKPTRYTRNDTIVRGVVWGQAQSAKR